MKTYRLTPNTKVVKINNTNCSSVRFNSTQVWPSTTCTVTMTHEGSGSTAINGEIVGSKVITKGSNATFTAYPSTDYYFSFWSVDRQVYRDNPLTVKINYSTTCNARFLKYVHITATGEHCTFEGLKDAYEYMELTNIKCVPDSGYIFDHWSDGSTENPREFNATEDVSLVATVVEEPVTISVFGKTYTFYLDHKTHEFENYVWYKSGSSTIYGYVEAKITYEDLGAGYKENILRLNFDSSYPCSDKYRTTIINKDGSQRIVAPQWNLDSIDDNVKSIKFEFI